MPSEGRVRKGEEERDRERMPKMDLKKR